MLTKKYSNNKCNNNKHDTATTNYYGNNNITTNDLGYHDIVSLLSYPMPFVLILLFEVRFL